MKENDVRIQRARRVLQQAQERRERLKQKCAEQGDEYWKQRLSEQEATVRTLRALLLDLREIP